MKQHARARDGRQTLKMCTKRHNKSIGNHRIFNLNHLLSKKNPLNGLQYNTASALEQFVVGCIQLHLYPFVLMYMTHHVIENFWKVQ